MNTNHTKMLLILKTVVDNILLKNLVFVTHRQNKLVYLYYMYPTFYMKMATALQSAIFFFKLRRTKFSFF